MAEGEDDRYQALEQRVRVLEQAASPAPDLPRAGSDGGRWWLLDRLATYTGSANEHEGTSGSIAYGGQTMTPGNGEVSWQAEHALPAVLGADLDAAAAVLSALGHTVRLEILRHLLLGARTLADLGQIPNLGTSGQLHHHLRELRSAGLVVHQRNNYAAAPDRVVAWLVILAAAVGPAALASVRTPQSPDIKEETS